jgi:hypothetical protein
MKTKFFILGVVFVIACLGVVTAFAGIAATTGAIVSVTPPASVLKGEFESDTAIHLFKEQEAIELTNNVAVDIQDAGTYTGNNALLTPGTVEAGTCVNSYFLHMDPATGGIYLSGSVTFDEEVLGLVALNDQLDASDWLGAPGTFYAKASDGEIGRRVELQATSPGTDEVALSIDKKTVTVNLWVDPTWTDQMRILTQGTCEIQVGIDIKPGSYPNSLNINGKGVIPVAILGSADFDVNNVDVSTLAFAGLAVRVKGNGSPQCSVEDVSGDFTYPEGAPDGYPDLVCQFVDDPTYWVVGDSIAELNGSLNDGTSFVGSDSINVVKITE